MKKPVLKFIISAVLIAMPCAMKADPLVQPVRTLEIPLAGDVVIDGVAEYCYSAEQTTDVFNPTGWSGPADYTCTFKVCYDYQFLYLYVQILDDFECSMEYPEDPNPWTYDNVEVFISLDTTGSTDPTSSGYSGDTNCIQLRICRGPVTIQTPGRVSTNEYIYYWENTAAGWLFETAIPWTCVLSSGQVPEDFMDYLDGVHGFDLMGADSDEPGPDHRDCQTAWDMDDPDDPADRTEDNAWTNRSVFGIMTLEEIYVPPPPPPWNNVDLVSDNQISVYPNPAGNTIHFEAEGLNTVKIYSLAGVKLMDVETTGEVNISGLKSGMYLAECDKGFVKFIKE